MNARLPVYRRALAVRTVVTVLTAVSLAALAACAADAPAAPRAATTASARVARSVTADASVALATLRRVTTRYHDLQAARDDGFTLLHPCENRPGEGPVGLVYYNPERLMDGVIDTERPDALIYEPSANGPTLVAVELAVPDVGQPLPTFFGATFQREEEFGVLALHAWVWRQNPEGVFAETNPRVSCGEA